MSILIKGMEMPTSCIACQLKMNCDDCEGWECVCVPLREKIGYLDDLLADKRRDDCPLCPVPPHGRLIDADARVNVQVYNDEFEDFQTVNMSIDDLLDSSWIELEDDSTIIPAEEGKRNRH